MIEYPTEALATEVQQYTVCLRCKLPKKMVVKTFNAARRALVYTLEPCELTVCQLHCTCKKG